MAIASFSRVISVTVFIGIVVGSLHVLAQEVSNRARNAERILHGELVKAGQGPWAVSIRRQRSDPPKVWGHMCGGSFFVACAVSRQKEGDFVAS